MRRHDAAHRQLLHLLQLRQQHRLRLIRHLGLALVAFLVLAPGAAASVRCSHTDPPAEELRVVPYEDPRIDLDFASGTVRRKGSRILVLDGLSHAVRCAGPAPTAANTKTILFLQDGLSFATVNLSGGLPAPQVDFRAGLGALAYGFVKGTARPDRWALAGTTAAVGLRLDPARPEDLQVSWDGLGTSVPVIQPGKGNDSVDASAVARHAILLIRGGEGNDTLLGSRFGDGIEGGWGRDVLEGGGGNDELDGRDGDRDRIDCGAGAGDRARVGPRDSIKGCETIRRPGHRHRGPIPKPPWLS